MSAFKAGILAVVVIALAAYFGFTKANPFANPFELQAAVRDAENLKSGAPVRIAGVDVGKVVKVEPAEDGKAAAIVKMELQKDALPVHRDAALEIRSRIFLEGNFFVDLRPGSPSAGVMKSGDSIPVNQTANPVQFGQILTALQSDTREDLKTALREYSVNALRGGGARGFNRSIPYWEPAYKGTALASEATLGQESGDLQRVLRGQQQTLAALSEDEESLKDLVSNFNTTAGAFAQEEQALAQAVPALRDVTVAGPPALRSLSSSLPALRAWARDARPGVRSSGPTIDESRPFIRQARLLMSRPELRGLVRDLKPTIPALAKLNVESGRSNGFFDQTRALARCTNEVLVPFAREPIPDPDFESKTDNEGSPVDNSDEPFYKQAPRGLPGLAGESRIHDANSPIYRVLVSAGSQTFFETNKVFGTAEFTPNGTRPAMPDERPVYRPGTPCETQEPPNMRAAKGGRPDIAEFPTPSTLSPEQLERLKPLTDQLVTLLSHLERRRKGLPSVDPIDNQYRPALERKLRELGLELDKNGRIVERGENERETVP
jgi:virulence factor Mce-like protein